MKSLENIKNAKFLDGAPQGVDQLVVQALSSKGHEQIVILRDEARLAQFVEGMQFVMPDSQILAIPAWDCLPYDRISPHSSITSRRLASLAKLILPRPKDDKPRLIVTTVNGWLQKVPAPSFLNVLAFTSPKGNKYQLI